MAVFRVNKNSNYSTIGNHHLREKNMSLKAKGLLTVMLSLRDDWDYSIAGLTSICKESETAVKSTLKELREFGYLNVTKMMPDQTESGRIEYVYDIYEQPTWNQEVEKQGLEKQVVENQPLEIQPLENIGQLNTKKSSTYESNTEESSTKKDRVEKRKRFVPPSPAQVAEYAAERGFPDFDAEKFVDFYASKGWMVGRSKMKDWRASVRTWLSRERAEGVTENAHQSIAEAWGVR